MTITEARAVDVVCRHLAGSSVDGTELANALAYLQLRAYSALEVPGAAVGPVIWHDRLVGRGWAQT